MGNGKVYMDGLRPCLRYGQVEVSVFWLTERARHNKIMAARDERKRLATEFLKALLGLAERKWCAWQNTYLV